MIGILAVVGLILVANPSVADAGTPAKVRQAKLAVVSAAVHGGVRGVAYVESLRAAGGVPPYHWSAAGLPKGLLISTTGSLYGSPRSVGQSSFTLRVSDAQGHVASRVLELRVSSGLPDACIVRSCSMTTPDIRTVKIPASSVDELQALPGSPRSWQLRLHGVAPSIGDIVTVAPVASAASGLVGLVTAASAERGVVELTIEQGGPTDAFADGIVHVLPPDFMAKSSTDPVAAAGLGANFGCTASAVTTGTDLTTSLSPSIAAIWHHPLFGGKGFYIGSGGLKLFQIDLDSSIGLDLHVSAGRQAICTASLGSIRRVLPAGDLGAVVVELRPTLTLTVGAKAEIHTSVTLSCGAEYRWSEGKEYRTSYCVPRYDPLTVSSDSGINVSLSTSIQATVSVDGIAGFSGTLGASITGAYRPTLQPSVILDASADYDLSACLACLWSGSPARVSLVSGNLFHRTLYTSNNGYRPPASPSPGPSNPNTSGGTAPSNPGQTQAPSGQSWREQESTNHPVNTFTDYHSAGGQGQAIAAGQWVDVSCKVYDPTIASARPDGYWYRIASAPWNDRFYAPANTFMNGGTLSGPGVRNTDQAVGNCGASGGPPSSPQPGTSPSSPGGTGNGSNTPPGGGSAQPGTPGSGSTPPTLPATGDTLTYASAIAPTAPNGFVIGKTIRFDTAARNPGGLPVRVARMRILFQGPQTLDVTCDGGKNITIAPGATWTCTTSVVFSTAGSYSYWADWDSGGSHWHEGQLGGHYPLPIAASISTGDTQPPLAPGNLVAEMGLTSAALSWHMSSDNVGVVAYDVLVNGSTVGVYEPAVSGYLATMTYTVSGLACGTNYQTTVVARDAAGNTSPTMISVSTSPCPPPPSTARLDQSNPANTTESLFGDSGHTNDRSQVGQFFKPSSSQTLVEVHFWMSWVDQHDLHHVPTDGVQAELYSATASTGANTRMNVGSLLATSTNTVSGSSLPAYNPGNTTEQTFTFSGVGLTAGNYYFVAVKRTGSLTSADEYAIGFSGGPNTYGQGCSTTRSAVSGLWVADVPLEAADLAFKTFYA